MIFIENNNSIFELLRETNENIINPLQIYLKSIVPLYSFKANDFINIYIDT